MDADERRARAGAEAAEWWVLLQGTLTRSDREKYVDWLRESPVHIAEMLRLAQIHRALDQFQLWSEMPVDGRSPLLAKVAPLRIRAAVVEKTTGSGDQRPASRILAWSLASVLVLALSIGALVLQQSRGQTIQTDRGERREVELADGSVIQVDPATRIRVKYMAHARRVFLDRGRALFHVAKNAERPFLVEINNTTVRAVGTAFAVERHDETIVVTVAEGRVAVFPADLMGAPSLVASPSSGRTEKSGIAALATTASTPSAAGHEPADRLSAPMSRATAARSEIYLTANQQITVNESGGAEPIQLVDSTRVLAWANGRVVLENTSVADAISEFNRANRIQIVLKDAALGRRPVSGFFNSADPESFAAFLSTVTRVRVTHADNADIVIEAAP